MSDSKILELAKKLKALSEQGVGGEKINAQKMLAAIMKKHNLTIEDIEGEKKEFAYFKVGVLQSMIWAQVVSSVIGAKFDTYVSKKKRGYRIIKVTAFQAVEIQFRYDFYWKLFKEELQVFKAAFIAKNNIYHPGSDKLDIDDISKEEYERLKRVQEMADSIKQGQLLKQIES